ncbi:hypothetical protein DPMN_083966 [Dreissena polymorpha]|uniref:Uncharacterized protein n=1 Tax=Dreissena polymorpha TaxID=45954 RepID=A0A9D4BBM5_DREPO|nr:hypothetical protein DPMN_083966 [Dreissena polymorpha]
MTRLYIDRVKYTHDRPPPSPVPELPHVADANTGHSISAPEATMTMGITERLELRETTGSC